MTAAEAPWWRSAVVYQVYPRSFADADGDGVGDLAGIRSRLSHLQALGVDVVWLSPVYASPQADNGYDIKDYQAIDPVFGTLEDFDELLADVHRRGMRLVMDLVVNHTSDEHPWFVESRSSASPKRDWYWWRRPREGFAAGEPGAEPTNWESFFSGPAWTLDEATGEYYLHLFDRKQPDLNWENPQVRQAVYAMMRWWLDRGIDGFRMDVINFVSKDPRLPDGAPGARGLGEGFPHYANGPRLHEFLREMHDEVVADRPDRLLTVGEMPGVTVAEARLVTDPERHELDMVFQFEHVSLDHGPGGKFDLRPLDLRDLKASFGRWQHELADTGWNSLYWSNHDQPRVVSRFGDDERWWRESATALATVLHLHRGTPYVYQGEELGMTNAPVARSTRDLNDVEARRYAEREIAAGRPSDEVLAGVGRGGRDNARTPMQWDGTEHAGFGAAAPWLPVNPNHTWLNARAQYDDDTSVFHHYRRVIELRHERPVVAHGDFRMLLPDHPHVYAYERRWGDDRIVVLAHLADGVCTVDVAEAVGTSPVLCNVPGVAVDGSQVRLGPWEAVVLGHSPTAAGGRAGDQGHILRTRSPAETHDCTTPTITRGAARSRM